MNKKLLVSIVFGIFILGIGMISAGCTDSDGGKDYFTFGEVVVDSAHFYDGCYDDTLTEQFCNNGQVGQETYFCDNGCGFNRCLQDNEFTEYFQVPLSESEKISFNGVEYTFSSANTGCTAMNPPELKLSFNGNEFLIASFYQKELLIDSSKNIKVIYTGCTSDHNRAGITFYANKNDESSDCIDSDWGLNYYKKGIVTSKSNSYVDCCATSDGSYCVDEGSKINELYCKNGVVEQKQYSCPFGCESGKCIGTESSVEANNQTPVEIPIEDASAKIDYICQGCELNSKCYPFGYRKSGNFCSDTEEFISQLTADASCENNFECSSNVCVSSKCISEGFIQKILNWFKNLFGAN